MYAIHKLGVWRGRKEIIVHLSDILFYSKSKEEAFEEIEDFIYDNEG